MNIQKIFAVGYSEEYVFSDVTLNVKSLIENTVRYQDIYKATI
jgi:hypothetical protein